MGGGLPARGRELSAGLVWAMAVVVPGIGVEDLAPQGSDDPFAVGVHPRSTRRGLHNLDVIGREDCIEGARVPVPVTDQQAQ